MSFGFPAFLWAALSLIPLAAVYFIRTRPRRQAVNAFFLWQRVFQQKAASSLFQKLRNLLSLLLVALAFLAAILALMRPRFDSGETPDMLIIIDRSASMQGSTDGKTRLDAAKEIARSWVTALSGSQRAAIASVAGKLEYNANLTTRSRRLTSIARPISSSQRLRTITLYPGTGWTDDWVFEWIIGMTLQIDRPRLSGLCVSQLVNRKFCLHRI